MRKKDSLLYARMSGAIVSLPNLGVAEWLGVG